MKRASLSILALLVLLGLMAVGYVPSITAQGDEEPVKEEACSPSDPGVAVAMAPLQSSGNYCFDCHTNIEQLKLLGEEKVVEKAPSEGSG